MHLYTDTDTPISTDNFILLLVPAGFSYTCDWWNAKTLVCFQRSCPTDYGKLIRMRINKLIYEIQENKHNSLHPDGYIFTSYIWIKCNKLNIFWKALPHRLWESFPNKEILNILRVIKRYLTLTLFWKCRLFTTFVHSGQVFSYQILTKS